jgi:hypothetical protein
LSGSTDKTFARLLADTERILKRGITGNRKTGLSQNRAKIKVSYQLPPCKRKNQPDPKKEKKKSRPEDFS